MKKTVGFRNNLRPELRNKWRKGQQRAVAEGICGRCVERPKANHARIALVPVASFRNKKPTKTVKGQAARKAPTKCSMVTVE